MTENPWTGATVPIAPAPTTRCKGHGVWLTDAADPDEAVWDMDYCGGECRD